MLPLDGDTLRIVIVCCSDTPLARMRKVGPAWAVNVLYEDRTQTVPLHPQRAAAPRRTPVGGAWLGPAFDFICRMARCGQPAPAGANPSPRRLWLCTPACVTGLPTPSAGVPPVPQSGRPVAPAQRSSRLHGRFMHVVVACDRLDDGQCGIVVEYTIVVAGLLATRGCVHPLPHCIRHRRGALPANTPQAVTRPNMRTCPFPKCVAERQQ